ncbi:HAD family hydrolase [Candidatus Lokiarchaeum ossiferum]
MLWDWNGTLLNDVDIVVASINSILLNYNLPQVSVNYYKSIFTFPVIEYYEKLGFNFDDIDFSELAKEFYNEYLPRLEQCGLYSQVQSILTHFNSIGYQQHIVSAMQHDHLVESVENLGIAHKFDSVNGLRDLFAASKAELAHQVIIANDIDVKSTWFIGDTIHDFEVAKEIQCQHVLVSNGHHTHQKLLTVTSRVVPDLSKIFGIINKEEKI